MNVPKLLDITKHSTKQASTLSHTNNNLLIFEDRVVISYQLDWHLKGNAVFSPSAAARIALALQIQALVVQWTNILLFGMTAPPTLMDAPPLATTIWIFFIWGLNSCCLICYPTIASYFYNWLLISKYFLK